MIKVHFYRSETAADSFIKDHPLYNRVKRGWQLNSQGKRVYGYWVGYRYAGIISAREALKAGEHKMMSRGVRV